jgi:hypothetical protein
MRYLTTYILDGTASYHQSEGYDDWECYDLVDDQNDATLEEIIRRHDGERLVITIQVLGPPRTRRDWLHRLSAELSRMMYCGLELGKYQLQLEEEQEFQRRKHQFAGHPDG